MSDTMDDAGRTSGMNIDTALVRELAELLESSHLTEIEVKDGERTIRVARSVTAVQGFAPAANWGPAPAASPAAPGVSPRWPLRLLRSSS